MFNKIIPLIASIALIAAPYAMDQENNQNEKIENNQVEQKVEKKDIASKLCFLDENLKPVEAKKYMDEFNYSVSFGVRSLLGDGLADQYKKNLNIIKIIYPNSNVNEVKKTIAEYFLLTGLVHIIDTEISQKKILLRTTGQNIRSLFKFNEKYSIIPDISSLLIREKHQYNIGKMGVFFGKILTANAVGIQQKSKEEDNAENNFEKFSSNFCSVSVDHLNTVKKTIQQRLNN